MKKKPIARIDERIETGFQKAEIIFNEVRLALMNLLPDEPVPVKVAHSEPKHGRK